MRSRRLINGGFEEVSGAPVWVDAENDVNVDADEDLGSGEAFIDDVNEEWDGPDEI